MIEFSAFDLENKLLGWNRVQNETTITPITRSYFELDRTLIDYNFNLIETGYLVLNNGEFQKTGSSQIAVSPADDLNDIGFDSGNYKVQYQLIKDEIGNDNEGLFIKEISPSRKELKLAVQNNASLDLIDEFVNANSDNVRVSEVISQIIFGINSARLDEIYFEVAERDDTSVRLSTEIKFFYSLPRDIDVINFIDQLFVSNNDVIVTIKYQFENWLFSNFKKFKSFDEIRATYKSLIQQIVRFQLTEKSTLKTEQFEEYVGFFVEVFDNVFITSINASEELYRGLNGESLKEALNFRNNTLLLTVNKELRNENGQDLLLIKLKNELPDSIQVNNRCIVSRLVRDPVFQDTVFYQNQVVNLNKIRGPNFYGPDTQNLESTRKLSMDELIPSGSSVLDRSNVDKNLNIDYRFFDNFIKFSSAVSRLDNYESKLNQISELEDDLDTIGTTDINDINERNIKQVEINDIKKSFDGYETFLFNSPEWFFDHTAQIGESRDDGTFETSASLYDRDNEDSLFNNTQDFIVEDDGYSDYTTFVNMTGQMFDQVWL
ncbi:MAG: hypothetical protein ACXACA_06320, partial [Candidatus Ranarchaeia archaeon]